MASDFMETNRALSRELRERARALGVFDHPDAKGDGREDLIAEFLRERIGTTFGVSKAEVIDSEGNTTPEFDAVIYDQSVAACLKATSTRKIVRIETVAVVVEVKSRLNGASWRHEHNRVLNGIGRMKRCYNASPFMQLVRGFLPAEVATATDCFFKEGVGGIDEYMNVPAILNAYFGFDGPDATTGHQFISTPLLDLVCVLDKYTLAKRSLGFEKRANPGDVVRLGTGEDALGAFLHAIVGYLDTFRAASQFVYPAQRYFRADSTEPGSRKMIATS